MNQYIFIYSASILYLACSFLLFFRLKKPTQSAEPTTYATGKKQVLLIGFAAVCLHTLNVYSSIHTDTGINLGFYNAISIVGLFIALFTLVATWRHPIDILTVVILPIAAITMLLDIDNSSAHRLPADSSKALIFHVFTSIIAYSLLALAALQAILLSIQNKFLHNHQPGRILKIMPPLRNMEALLFEVIIAGFVALTISLGSGLLFLENMFAQQLAHKTVLSIIAWFVFLILLIGHWKLGWRGRTAIRWTLTGFVFLMLAYFGSKFVLEIILS